MELEALDICHLIFFTTESGFECTGLLTLTDIEENNDPNVRGDAFKTLFVSRLSYDTKEKDLEREFGRFGPIERVSFLASLPSRVPN